jgi:hypothetical protein
MIVAMQNFIPDRLAVSSEKTTPHCARQTASHISACPPRAVEEAPPDPGPSQSTFATALATR